MRSTYFLRPLTLAVVLVVAEHRPCHRGSTAPDAAHRRAVLGAVLVIFGAGWYVFRSDNLLSNELNFQYVIPELRKTAQQIAQPRRVYLGVGPEQNFSYIAAVKPSMAFIIDIRHGNLDVHLMYKALFEMSANRAEFVSRLFSLEAAWRSDREVHCRRTLQRLSRRPQPDAELYNANLKAVIDHLKTKHKFPLSDGDLDGIKWAMDNYYRFGPVDWIQLE